MIYTYQDLVDHVIDFVGGANADSVQRDARRVIDQSYRELANAHRWPYLFRQGRLFTVEPFSTGTIAYDHTGGAYERTLTLSGGTWPSWAAAGYVRFSNTTGDPENFVNYRVAQRYSNTVLGLDPQVNPGSDIPSGTTFRLYQDTFLLPADFIEQDRALYERNFGGMAYVTPQEWMAQNRYDQAQGQPHRYTITGDTQYPQRLVMRVAPWPDEIRSIDFYYKRRPRPLVIQSLALVVTVTSGSTTITASTPVFLPSMVGSVLRVSGNARAPSSMIGSAAGVNPPAIEGIIQGWSSNTVVLLDRPAPASLASVGATVSDPVDMEAGAMINALLRCLEKNMAKARNLKDKTSALSDWLYALEQGKAASNVSFTGRYPGSDASWVYRYKDMPMGPDQS